MGMTDAAITMWTHNFIRVKFCLWLALDRRVSTRLARCTAIVVTNVSHHFNEMPLRLHDKLCELCRQATHRSTERLKTELFGREERLLECCECRSRHLMHNGYENWCEYRAPLIHSILVSLLWPNKVQFVRWANLGSHLRCVLFPRISSPRSAYALRCAYSVNETLNICLCQYATCMGMQML